MKNSRSGLFLIEFLIALLFFSLACAVCIQLFVSSYLLSCNSVNKNHACMWAENVAEIYSASGGDYNSTLTMLSNTEKLSSSDLKAAIPKNLSSFLSSDSQKQSKDFTASLAKNNSDQIFYLYFDKNWNLLHQSKDFSAAYFTLILSDQNISDFSNADLYVYSFRYHSADLLYSLSIKKYHQKTLS
jgi:Tfp pilus assembly protein PilV